MDGYLPGDAACISSVRAKSHSQSPCDSTLEATERVRINRLCPLTEPPLSETLTHMPSEGQRGEESTKQPWREDSQRVSRNAFSQVSLKQQDINRSWKFESSNYNLVTNYNWIITNYNRIIYRLSHRGSLEQMWRTNLILAVTPLYSQIMAKVILGFNVTAPSAGKGGGE